MKTYWRILGFAKPLGKYVVPYFFFTILHTIFNMLTYAMIIPVLNSLFTPSEMVVEVTQMPAFDFSMDYVTGVVNYALFKMLGTGYDVMSVLAFVAGTLVFVSLFSNLFRYLGQWTVEKMKINTLCRMRNKVYDNVIGLNLGFFSNEKKGDIMSRITSDVQVVQFCISNTMHVVFRDPLLIISYVFMMIKISPALSVFSVLYLPIVALVIGSVVKRLRAPARRVQETFGDMTSALDETLGGIKVIKGYNAEGFFGGRFHNINKRFARISRRMARRQQLASPMSEFLGITAAAGLMVYGGYLALNGSLGVAGFIAYIGIFTQITRPIRSFADAFANINQGIAAGNRVFALLDTPSSITNAPDAKELMQFDDSIEFRDVHFSYEEKEVIKGVSFSVKKGQTVALVGPSGGGKTTITDLIPRFYDINAGQILIDGIDIRDYTLESLRNAMGIVSQDTVLFNDTIENNIRLGNDCATHEEVVAAAKVANADRFITECSLGYDTNIGDRGAKLSGGQRQRLSIARAVLKDPEILILDEATSALDTESEKLVQESLDKLRTGRTSIVIAHRLSTICNADKIIVIEDGCITEQGTHAQLIKEKGTYAKLIQMQQFSGAETED